VDDYPRRIYWIAAFRFPSNCSRKFGDLYVWTKFPNKIVPRRYVLWLGFVINLNNLSDVWLCLPHKVVSAGYNCNQGHCSKTNHLSLIFEDNGIAHRVQYGRPNGQIIKTLDSRSSIAGSLKCWHGLLSCVLDNSC